MQEKSWSVFESFFFFPQCSFFVLFKTPPSTPHTFFLPTHHTHSAATSILTSVYNLLHMSSQAHINLVVSELLYPSQVIQLLDDRMFNLYVCGHPSFRLTDVTCVGQAAILTSAATYFEALLMYRYPITIYIDLVSPLQPIHGEK